MNEVAREAGLGHFVEPRDGVRAGAASGVIVQALDLPLHQLDDAPLQYQHFALPLHLPSVHLLVRLLIRCYRRSLCSMLRRCSAGAVPAAVAASIMAFVPCGTGGALITTDTANTTATTAAIDAISRRRHCPTREATPLAPPLTTPNGKTGRVAENENLWNDAGQWQKLGGSFVSVDNMRNMCRVVSVTECSRD